jgi:stage III sporulation protein AF
MVLTSIIANLLGKSSYKKYINLITGIILVILVISPLLKLFQLDKTLDYYFTTNTLLADAQDLDSQLKDMENGQKDAIFDEYKEQIKIQVAKILKDEKVHIYEIEVTIDEDDSSSNYGNILSLNVMGGHVVKDESSKEAVNIDTVKIDKIKIEKQVEEPSSEKNYLSPEEINAKNKLSDFYNINSDNINISIQE